MITINNVAIYTDAETAFISTLDEVAQNNIRRGLTTPYDYDMKSVVIKVTGVSLDEDTNKRTPVQALGMYEDFYGMLTRYYTYHADDCNINELHIACRMSTHLKDDLHKILFAEYLTEYWNAWILDVIDGNYKYIHMINIVWESWLEYMSK